MQYRFKFWTFWVVVNAIASFSWAILIDHSISYILGMVVGIVCFIVAYTLFDAYLLKKQYIKAHQALIMGIYIKAGLQFLNIIPPIAPELWVGVIVKTLLQPFIVPTYQPFLFALLATLLTGFFLSLLVGVISLVVGLVQGDSNQAS